jgi:membrane-bound serine protease (ClpP class)
MDTMFLTLGLFLILVGLLLLAADLFLTSGVMLVLAISAIVVGLAFVFHHDTLTGVYALGGVALTVPTMTWLLLRLGPMRSMAHSAVVDDTVATMPINVELEGLRGRFGKTISALRPAGVVDFDGRRIDALTEGMMVEPGQWVRCVEVRAGKVIVRPVDKPSVSDLEAPLLG